MILVRCRSVGRSVGRSVRPSVRLLVDRSVRRPVRQLWFVRSLFSVDLFIGSDRLVVSRFVCPLTLVCWFVRFGRSACLSVGLSSGSSVFLLVDHFR